MTRGCCCLAGTLQETLLFAQLHSALAGVDGDDNIDPAGRQPLNWDTPDSDGRLRDDLAGQLHRSEPRGLCTRHLVGRRNWWRVLRRVPLGGDVTFNSAGEFQVTAIDFEGTSV